MNFAILRTAKLKDWGAIGGSLAHTYRTRDTPNADPERLASNEHHGPEAPEAVVEAMKARMPEKIRKNGVLAIEYFIGGSPDHFKSDDGAKYFEDAREWLIKRHGAENVISTHVHRDETSPHMVAYVVPIKDGKLNARHFLGGPEAMRMMQTEFAQEVGQKHGLERGVEGSQAKHQTVREFYARANDAEVQLDRVTHPTERHVEKRLLTRTEESDQQFAHRVASDVKAQLKPAVVKAAQVPMTERRVKELQRQNDWLRREARPWFDATRDLTDDAKRLLVGHVVRRGSELRRAAAKAAEVVVGWFHSHGGDGHGFTIKERDSGRLRELTFSAERDLHHAGVALGDLVEVSDKGARILERERDRGRDRGPSLGR